MDMDATELRAFLPYLTSERHVSASLHEQALRASRRVDHDLFARLES